VWLPVTLRRGWGRSTFWLSNGFIVVLLVGVPDIIKVTFSKPHFDDLIFYHHHDHSSAYYAGLKSIALLMALTFAQFCAKPEAVQQLYLRPRIKHNFVLINSGVSFPYSVPLVLAYQAY